jgi:hypothetical protein
MKTGTSSKYKGLGCFGSPFFLPNIWYNSLVSDSLTEENRKIKKSLYSIIVIFLALAPLTFGSSAQAETRAEHDAIVAQAQAAVNAAQDALVASQGVYDAAVQAKIAADAQVISNKTTLDNLISDVQNKERAVLEAQALLASAEQEYNTALISDPEWMRPNKEQVEQYDVPYTVQVPYTQLVPRTELIPRTILVPHTETVTHTNTTVISSGLTAKVYNMAGYNNAPPLPTENRLVSTQLVQNINYQWGGGYILNTYLSEDTIVKFTGYITIPQNGTYGFYAPGDDGVRVIIDGNTIINDWYDKGGGGSTTSTYLSQGSHEFTLWFYENGGGANVWAYWAKPGYGYEIIPATAFQQVVTETTYEEVTTYTEETVYDEVVVYDEVTFYRDEVRYRKEERIILVPDEDATAPLIHNPDLLPAVTAAQASLNVKQNNLQSANTNLVSGQQAYELSLTQQNEKAGIIDIASADVLNKQQELNVAQSELEAIPPFKELPPTPEKTTEPTPEPTKVIIEPLPEPDKTSTPEELPTAVEQAQAQLEERATANDTGVLPYTVADAVTEIQAEQTLAVLSNPVALVGAVGESIAQTAQFVGELFTDPGKTVSAVFKNVSQAGLDMSDDQREKAQEVIVPVVIVSQIASMMVGRIK